MKLNKPTVIHIRNAPANWSNDPQCVYIGRPRKASPSKGDPAACLIGENGWLGNPYSKGERCFRCGQVHETGGSTLPCFTEYLETRALDPKFKAGIVALMGKTLLCFCAPNPCHGEVLAKYAAQWYNEEHRTHIITTQLGSGWAAVQLWWNDAEHDLDPFWEPYQTGIGRYATAAEAEEEAKGWAEAEEMEYRGIQ